MKSRSSTGSRTSRKATPETKRLRHTEKILKAFEGSGIKVKILENQSGASVLPGVPAYVRRSKQKPNAD
jgi:hypothetical protein